MTYRQEAEKVLAVWRAAERALDVAEAGSTEAEELQAEVLRLRDRYHALIAEAGQRRVDDSRSLDIGRMPDMSGSG
jgi:hypothetical protein